MITLVTPHAESMYDTDGMDKAFDQLRNDVRKLSQTIGRTPGHCVLVISSDGEEMAPESVLVKDDEPVVTVRLARKSYAEPSDPMTAALAATYNIGIAVQSFCGRGECRSHLVVIDDVDFYFCPSKELGTFTQQLDRNAKLIEQISSIGECLAGYDGHLVLAASLSQYPERLRGFLDNYGWSWIQHQAGRFEHQFGVIPDVLKPHCSLKRQPEAVTEWSKSMTIQELALRFGIHRNTMSKRLRKGDIPSRKVGGLYQVPVSHLPKK